MAEKKTEKKTKTEKAEKPATKKKSKAEDMSALTKDELLLKARELQTRLFDLKIKRATAQLEDHSEIWKARKGIARAKTYLTQKSSEK